MRPSLAFLSSPFAGLELTFGTGGQLLERQVESTHFLSFCVIFRFLSVASAYSLFLALYAYSTSFLAVHFDHCRHLAAALV
jgi:hypothetical protein